MAWDEKDSRNLASIKNALWYLVAAMLVLVIKVLFR